MEPQLARALLRTQPMQAPPAKQPSLITSTTDDHDALALAVRRTRMRARAGSIVKGSAVAGALLMAGGPALPGCVAEGTELELGEVEQADWAQYEGQRNTEMVQYLGTWWSECTNPYTRFGCGTVEMFLKVRVKPVVGADLSAKRVGVIYRSPYDHIERTALGEYHTTWSNGDEEWHVKVSVPSWRDFFVFNTFYQDGAYQTYFDDNQGEFHAVNNGPSNQVVQVNPWASTVALDGSDLRGSIQVRVADLDYDKELALYGTCDGWRTVMQYDSGGGENNSFYWTRDIYGAEEWQIDMDVPCDSDVFEYAVVYKHGVVNDATPYWFWDNNRGHNHRVEVAPIVD